MDTFKDVIALWRTRGELADDLGIDPRTVQKWAERDRIDGDYWFRIVAAAKARRFKLKLEDLARIADRRLAA